MSRLNNKVMIIIDGICHEIGISDVSIRLFEKGIDIKTGTKVEIIII